MSTKVLLIGLDSADPRLLAAWAAAGELPAWQALAASGAQGVLEDPLCLGDHGNWVSLVTGVSPATHALLHHRQMFPGSYESRPVLADDLHMAPFWQSLSALGRRVAIIDVPRAPITPGLNGIALSDWIVHPRQHADMVSWPPSLTAEIAAEYGTDPTVEMCEHGRQPLELAGLVEGLEAGIDAKARLVKNLLQREAWDLFTVVFKEAHCVGHAFWHAHDPGHPWHDPSVRQSFGDPLARVYRALDRAIGEMVAAVGPDTTILLFTNSGMAANHTGSHLLDDVLLRLDPPTSRTSPLRAVWRRFGFKSRTRIWQQLAPVAVRLRNAGLAGRRAFAIEYNEMAGAVSINRRGRFPAGCVEPGSESDSLIEFLAAELSRLVDADDGTPIVDRVLRPAAFADGPHRDALPDLLVLWRRDRSITSAASPRIGIVRGVSKDPRSGNHMPAARFVARGPGIAAGIEVPPAQMLDIPPTVVALLGAPLNGLEGRPIAALAAATPPARRSALGLRSSYAPKL